MPHNIYGQHFVNAGQILTKKHKLAHICGA